MAFKNITLRMLNKIKKFIYYQRVVLYRSDLHKKINFITSNEYLVMVASLEELEVIFSKDKESILTNNKSTLWKEKILNGLWQCFICKDGDAIIGQALYSKEEIFFGGTKWLAFSLPENSVYGFKTYLTPYYRGKTIGQAIISFRSQYAKNEGIDKLYTAINSDNIAARHNEEKIGGRIVGSVIFLECRFFNKVYITPGIHREGLKIKYISAI